MIYINGAPLEVTMFPDKTSQVWKLSNFLLNHTNHFNITWDFEYEGEFMHLAQLKMLLDAYRYTASLKLSYLPYGRQDKFVGNETTFALRTFAELLNTLRFQEVFIMDPHSDVALELINNRVVQYPSEEFIKVYKETKTELLCYPDKGAVLKYTNVYINVPYIYGEKVRDQATGNIVSYKLAGNPKGMTVLIRDDICDGGATFIMLTEQLLKAGAKEVHLYVTHGIFSKGIQILKDCGISRIFTAKGEV